MRPLGSRRGLVALGRAAELPFGHELAFTWRGQSLRERRARHEGEEQEPVSASLVAKEGALHGASACSKGKHTGLPFSSAMAGELGPPPLVWQNVPVAH